MPKCLKSTTSTPKNRKSFLLAKEKIVVSPIGKDLLAVAILWNNSKMTAATQFQIVADYLSHIALQKELDHE